MMIGNSITYELVKYMDIGYMYTLSFVIGFIFVIGLEKIMGTYALNQHTSIIRVILELIGIFWLYGIFIYLLNHLILLIPSPLNGWFGYDHQFFINNISLWILEYTILFYAYSSSIQNRIIFIYNYIMGTKIPYRHNFIKM